MERLKAELRGAKTTLTKAASASPLTVTEVDNSITLRRPTI